MKYEEIYDVNQDESYRLAIAAHGRGGETKLELVSFQCKSDLFK